MIKLQKHKHEDDFTQMLSEFTEVWEGIEINSIYLMKWNQRHDSFVNWKNCLDTTFHCNEVVVHPAVRQVVNLLKELLDRVYFMQY